MFLGSDLIITLRASLRERRRQRFQEHSYMSAPQLEKNVYHREGLLATSPRQFQGMNDVAQVPHSSLEAALHVHGVDADFTVMNRGIRICLPIQLLNRKLKIYVAFLACGCGFPSGDSYTVFAIYLRQVSDNLYTRILSDAWFCCDLVEIQIETIVPSSTCACHSLFVDTHGKPRSPWTQVDHLSIRVNIDISQLRTVLKKWKLTLSDKSSDEEIQSTSHEFNHDSNASDQQETLFVVKNESKEEELLLVVSSDFNGQTKSADVSVRVISLGPNELLPDAKHARSPDDIYRIWHQRAERDDFPASPCVATAKMSNGQEIVFTVIRVFRWPGYREVWNLLAVLQGNQDESELIL